MKLHSPQLVSLSEASLLHALMSETRRPNFLVVCRRVTVAAAVRHIVSYCEPPFHMVALPGLPTSSRGASSCSWSTPST